MNPLSSVKLIVVHCADTKPDMNVTIEDLHMWHVVRNGWSDIGYHYFIKFDGSIHECRPAKYAGAHCKKVNDISLAICLEGGYNGEDNFTQVQLDSLFSLITNIKSTYPNAAVIGHNTIDNKACPSFNVVEWYECKIENSGAIAAIGGQYD